VDIVSKVRRHAHERPDAPAVILLTDGDSQELTLSYRELNAQAEATAAALRTRGLSGRCVVLSFPTGLDFVRALLGCFYSGAIAVPTPPIKPSDKLGEARLALLAQDCGAALILSTAATITAQRANGQSSPLGPPWSTLDELGSGGDPSELHWPTQEDVAFIQYTSGSTAAPKGVIVSYSNLAANFAATGEAMRMDADTTFLSWLPLFHDMGLIGILLQALHRGQKLILMSPQHFIQKPIRWLRAISKYRATLSGGPNFAYDLCVRRSTPEQREGLDLSCWRVAFNGAEPVRASTLADFSEAFAASGFRPQALFPCYGMAETTLYASGGFTADAGAVGFDRGELANGVASPSADPSPSQLLVSCGTPPPAHEVVIVGPETRHRRPAGEIGEIWVRGPSVAKGYWGGRSPETFNAVTADGADGFLRTGDLGALFGDQLFVTGRIKDLIIVRGRNIYPQDVEWIAERCSAVAELGSAVAVVEACGDDERLVVVQELRRARGVPLSTIRSEIVAAVTGAIDVSPGRVVLVPAGSLPKTSSGKIRRHLVRQGLADRSLQTLDELSTGPVAETAS